MARVPKVAVLGGFERSGHDSAAEAIVHSAGRLGVDVVEIRWRDLIELNDLLLFHLHRLGSSSGLPVLESLTTDEPLQAAIVEDLLRVAPAVLQDCTAMISVHPWSTRFASAYASTATYLIDCHVEFTPFPVHFTSGIDLYTGVWWPRSVRPSFECGIAEIGIPVRPSFRSDVPKPRSVDDPRLIGARAARRT